MIEVPLANGGVTKIDDEDLSKVGNHRWYRWQQKRKVYVRRQVQFDGKRRVILLHRLILQTPEGFDTDHINGDGLDNRRANLRIATRSQNTANGSPHRDNTSGYKGVTKLKNRHAKPWVAQIQVGGRHICLGCFATSEEAARAYDAAAREHFGEFARTNFQEAAR